MVASRLACPRRMAGGKVRKLKVSFTRGGSTWRHLVTAGAAPRVVGLAVTGASRVPASACAHGPTTATVTNAELNAESKAFQTAARPADVAKAADRRKLQAMVDAFAQQHPDHISPSTTTRCKIRPPLGRMHPPTWSSHCGRLLPGLSSIHSASAATSQTRPRSVSTRRSPRRSSAAEFLVR
jgi:hypothetical protein